jgi:hypothetical protein
VRFVARHELVAPNQRQVTRSGLLADASTDPLVHNARLPIVE